VQGVDRESSRADVSFDSLIAGEVRFYQPRQGYRVNVDSVLLARFATVGRKSACAVDLGAGVGVVALLLSHFGAARELVLVEREASLTELAARNLALAGVTGRVVEADVESSSLSALKHSAALVVCNPPFYGAARHRVPRDAARGRARVGDVKPFLHAAARVLDGEKARAVFVYPAAALSELLLAAEAERLVPKRLRLVHPFSNRPARLALVEFRRARPSGLVVEPPLVEWLRPAVASEEFRRWTGG
jgi:tRNA1Val (adenine37-N6)-methyltransferase